MSQPDQVTLTQDQAYDLLSNVRRRFVISHLQSRDGPVALNELSRRIASLENEVPPDELTDQQIKRVYVSLYQTHLPKLEEAGLVDYDQDSGEVALTNAVTQLNRFLPEEETDDPPWPMIYAALATVGLFLFLFVTFVPGAPISLGTLGGLTILTFAAVTLVHYLSQRNT